MEQKLFDTYDKGVVMKPKLFSDVDLIRSRRINSSQSLRRKVEQLSEDKASSYDLDEIHCALPAFVKSTYIMTFSPDGQRVASTHGDHRIYICDLNTGKLIDTLEGHFKTPWCLAWHPSNNDILASGCISGEVRVWDLRSKACESWCSSHKHIIFSLDFHPIERLLVIATLNEIHLWDWSKPKPFETLTSCEKEKVKFVKFDSSGTKLITGISNSPQSSAFHADSLQNRIIDSYLSQRAASGDPSQSSTAAAAAAAAVAAAVATEASFVSSSSLPQAENNSHSSTISTLGNGSTQLRVQVQVDQIQEPQLRLEHQQTSVQEMNVEISGGGSGSSSSFSLPAARVQAGCMYDSSLFAASTSQATTSTSATTTINLNNCQRSDFDSNRQQQQQAAASSGKQAAIKRANCDEKCDILVRNKKLKYLVEGEGGRSGEEERLNQNKDESQNNGQDSDAKRPTICDRELTETSAAATFDCGASSSAITGGAMPMVVDMSDTVPTQRLADRPLVCPLSRARLDVPQRRPPPPLAVPAASTNNSNNNNPQHQASQNQQSLGQFEQLLSQQLMTSAAVFGAITAHRVVTASVANAGGQPSGGGTGIGIGSSRHHPLALRIQYLGASFEEHQRQASSGGGIILSRDVRLDTAADQHHHEAATAAAAAVAAATAAAALAVPLLGPVPIQVPATGGRPNAARAVRYYTRLMHSQAAPYGYVIRFVDDSADYDLGSGLSELPTGISSGAASAPQVPETLLGSNFERNEARRRTLSEAASLTGTPHPHNHYHHQYQHHHTVDGGHHAPPFVRARNQPPRHYAGGAGSGSPPNNAATLESDRALLYTQQIHLIHQSRAASGQQFWNSSGPIVNWNYRVQCWSFSRASLPNLKNIEANVVTNKCRIYNDASLDISADGRLLACLVQRDDVASCSPAFNLRIFSLAAADFGACLYEWAHRSNVISVSLSPLSGYIVVGLASPKFVSTVDGAHDDLLVAKVFKLQSSITRCSPSTSSSVAISSDGSGSSASNSSKTTGNTNTTSLELVRNVKLRRHDYMMGINAIRWLPAAAGCPGLIYGTTRGQLVVARPSARAPSAECDCANK